MINWEVIIWTCITIGVLLGIAALLLTFISARNIKKKASELKNLHSDLKPGMKVMFCSAIYGKVIKVKDDIVEVEIAKNVIVSVSRYAIQSVD
ncbi:preprotein translocase subunit YajC [Clostridium sp.]|uniref:preprotein translocase subunit YajC n=1 Tax=Clostridium sp. TaxID=1506 RepID=UPI002628AA11|nr:preprotein translocase subunit YajC [Clostridium sp.]